MEPPRPNAGHMWPSRPRASSSSTRICRSLATVVVVSHWWALSTSELIPKCSTGLKAGLLAQHSITFPPHIPEGSFGNPFFLRSMVVLEDGVLVPHWVRCRTVLTCCRILSQNISELKWPSVSASLVIDVDAAPPWWYIILSFHQSNGFPSSPPHCVPYEQVLAIRCYLASIPANQNNNVDRLINCGGRLWELIHKWDLTG